MDTNLNKDNYILGIIDPNDYSRDNVAGGANGFVRSILPYLNAHKVEIFGVNFGEKKQINKYIINQKISFTSIGNLSKISKIPARLKVLLYYMINRERILNSGVDILYIHKPECCIPFIFRNTKIPVIYHKHGSANPVSLSKYRFGRTIIFKKFFQYLICSIYKRANWIIAIDHLCLKDAVKNGAGNKTSLLRNAIDLNKFKIDDRLRAVTRKLNNLEDDMRSVLYVGRIEKTKGPGRILDCIPSMMKEGKRFHIFLAGSGTYRKKLENFVSKNNFENFVSFLGNVKHADLVGYYNMADVLALPSDMEGIPMVILESLACGTPVVATDVGGISDIVKNGVNGFIIDEAAPDFLCKAIKDICNMKLNKLKIQKTVEEYGSSKFVDTLEHIFAELIARRQICQLRNDEINGNTSS